MAGYYKIPGFLEKMSGVPDLIDLVKVPKDEYY
jgi:hypothetical protein